tara:strand:+ start:12436 stop:12579 length:144 start_codon:yes stop_codon:yes gene_type:complete
MQQKNIINEGFVRVEDPIGNNISVVTVIYTDIGCTVDIKWRDINEYK